MIVLDTAVLLYWTMAREQLSPKAAEAIDGAQDIIISSISIWEIGLKAKRGKLGLPLPIRDYVERLKEAEKVQIVPVTEATWLANLELPWEHEDPADRTIVATAGLLGCALITSDQEILSFYAAAVW
jgi:PIN domain nuclease of toxin-antitoxin system